jgi:hypothetical protein
MCVCARVCVLCEYMMNQPPTQQQMIQLPPQQIIQPPHQQPRILLRMLPPYQNQIKALLPHMP